MAVGGSALHWGGTCIFPDEDLRLNRFYGLAVDVRSVARTRTVLREAERRLGVSWSPVVSADARRNRTR